MTSSDKNLTQSLIKEVLSYSPDTGLFTWVKTRNNTRTGRTAGFRASHGYTLIKIHGRSYYAHRLAWLYVYGSLPVGIIDHINEAKDDNRTVNLRDVGRRENSENQAKAQANNKTGIRGVSVSRLGRFTAQICVKGVQTYLGLYDSAEEASAVYLAAKQRFHPIIVNPN